MRRPVNRTLLAKKTSIPQAVCSGIAAALHIPIIWLCISWFRLGYLGSAYAYVISSANTTALVYAWVFFTGRGPGIWGQKPTRDALKASFGSYARPRYVPVGVGTLVHV